MAAHRLITTTAEIGFHSGTRLARSRDLDDNLITQLPDHWLIGKRGFHCAQIQTGHNEIAAQDFRLQ